MLSNDHLIEITIHSFYFIFDYSWFLEIQLKLYKLLLFLRFNICQLFFFGVLVIIFAQLSVDLFVCIDWIKNYLSWNLFSDVLENVLWAVSKLEICIYPPPLVCGRLWRVWQLGVKTCSIQPIALIYLKYTSSSSFNPSFGNCWIVCIICIESEFIDPKTCPCMC